MNKIIEIIRYILGIPKTIFFNLWYLDLKDALKFPIIVSHKVKLRKLGGKIKLEKVKFGIVRIGFGTMECYDFTTTPTIFSNKGEIIFKGKIKIGSGAVISNEGRLIFGNNCNVTKSIFICRDEIEIGNDCLFGWDCMLMDTDHHHIYIENEKINYNKKIKIGNKVWMGAKVTILKGVIIAEGNVIAAGSIISSNIIEIKTIKNDVFWKE